MRGLLVAGAGQAQPEGRQEVKGTLRERVFARLTIDQENGCLLWTGCRVKGYGYVAEGQAPRLVHQLMYEWFIGPVPFGMEIDHLCRIRHCAAPAHLEAVTHAENLRRSRGHQPPGWNASKTHCPQGHPYDEANTIRTGPNKRACRQCKRERNKAAYARKKVTA
jgi:hypothetical protein